MKFANFCEIRNQLIIIGFNNYAAASPVSPFAIPYLKAVRESLKRAAIRLL